MKKKAKPAHWSGWPGGQRIQINFLKFKNKLNIWRGKTPNYQWQPAGTTDILYSNLSSALLCTTSDNQLFYLVLTFSYGFQ
jgi:hypothetical protein